MTLLSFTPPYLAHGITELKCPGFGFVIYFCVVAMAMVYIFQCIKLSVRVKQAIDTVQTKRLHNRKWEKVTGESGEGCGVVKEGEGMANGQGWHSTLMGGMVHHPSLWWRPHHLMRIASAALVFQ